MNRLFALADRFVYTLVGGVLVLLALGLLGHTAVAFVRTVRTDFINAVTVVVLDVLLVLIVMELFRTVLGFIRADVRPNAVGDLVPFLVIAAISVTRRVLALGAILGAEETDGTVGEQKFQHTMIELGVNAVVLIAVVVSLRLLKDYQTVARREGEQAERISQEDAQAEETTG